MKHLLLTFLAIVFASAPGALASPESPPSYDTSWGDYGTGFGQFRDPLGAAVDGSGNVHVVQNTSPCRVQKFTPDGVYLSQIGSCGTGDGQFSQASDVVIDGNGNIYVSEALGCRVQKFNASGTFLTKWGTYGTGNGQFDFPSGLAVDGSGNIYVVDKYNDRVQKFTSNGVFVLKWGSSGSGNGQFNRPIGIGIDGANNVYVTDRNDRIQKFTSSGSFLGAFGSLGTGDGQFSDPGDVDVDALGNIYVVDTGNSRMQKFSSNFSFLSKWGSWGTGTGQFYLPASATLSQDGYIYVVDTNNYRVQKFGPVGSGGGGGNTPVGSNVLVQIVPDTDILYAQVVSAGQTDLSIVSAGPAPPAGFQTVPASPRMYYNLTTSAAYAGSIELTIDYNPADVAGSESALRLYHWDENLNPPRWLDITIEVKTGPNTIRGVTTSLSTFAIVEPAAPTGIAEDMLATGIGLRPASPNPFRSRTALEFELAEPSQVRIQVLDLQGRHIRDLLPSGHFGPGLHEVVWDGRDEGGQRVSPGLYFFRLTTNRASATQKVILID